MKGLEVFVFILKNIPNMILKILRQNQLDIKDINKFFLHQAKYYALMQKNKLKIST
nr:hypothetical protein [Campylobacter jejuni]